MVSGPGDADLEFFNACWNSAFELEIIKKLLILRTSKFYVRTFTKWKNRRIKHKINTLLHLNNFRCISNTFFISIWQRKFQIEKLA